MGLIGICVALATVPLSAKFREMFDKYSNQERNLKICDSESADLSSPFKPTEVLDVLESVYEEPKTWPDSLDGHMIKGDGLKSHELHYRGSKPAALDLFIFRKVYKGGWQPQEKISLANCIRAYTSGSAYGEFMEGKKGELNVGEFADIERPHER